MPTSQETIVPHVVHHNLTCCGIPEYVPDGVYLQMVPPVYQNNRIPVPELQNSGQIVVNQIKFWSYSGKICLKWSDSGALGGQIPAPDHFKFWYIAVCWDNIIMRERKLFQVLYKQKFRLIFLRFINHLYFQMNTKIFKSLIISQAR